MHENTREWHSSQSVAQIRAKRPLSTGERDLNIGRISGRNRSKTIHSTHGSAVRYRALINSNNNLNNNNSNSNNTNSNNANSNNSNSNNTNSNNDSVNSQMSANSNINYFYRNYNERLNQSNIDGLKSTSAIDISPTFEYMDTNPFNDMPTVGQYLNSASQSLCPTFKHNICVKNNNLKSTIATNTITSTNDKDLRKFRASSLANNTYFDGKHEINKGIQQISTAKTDELATNNERMIANNNNNNNCFTKSTSILKQLLRSKVTSSAPLNPTENNANNTCHSIPTKAEKAQFRRSLDSATNLVFHRRNGLPLTSSPVCI